VKSLLILRHAKSSWKEPILSDHDRPLNNRGKRDAPRMGILVRREELVPDLIITSSAMRARKTADAVANYSGYGGELQIANSFYLAGPESYIEVLSELGDKYQRVMVVGHNPGMEELLEELTDVNERVVTAALAHVSLPIDEWRQLDDSVRGTLEGFWIPRDLNDIRVD